MTDPGSGFRLLGEEVRVEGWRISFVAATYAAPDGTVFTRDVIRHPGAVAVVPVTDAGTVLLVRQYRGALDRELLEIPAGTRDVEGEPPEETARRELTEEVGVVATDMRLLATMANSPGFCDELTLLYLATGLQGGHVERHGEEESYMEVVEIHFADVDAMVSSGELIDAQTILGLLMARQALAESPRPGPGS